MIKEKQSIVYWTAVSFDQISADDLSWLSKQEKQHYETFRFTKRRDEWLMGRWAAKKLLGSAYPSFNAVRMNEISILNETSGAPYVLVYGIRVPGVLSITHREGMACAAWVSDAAIKIGIDLEFVETKPDIFIHDYFTAEESQQVFTATEPHRALAASLVWSVKESLLKALQTGLRIDTREVAVSVSSFESSEQWRSIRVSRCAKHTGFVNAAWRSIGDFVLTCAALGECALDRPLLFQQV